MFALLPPTAENEEFTQFINAAYSNAITLQSINSAFTTLT
jgi:hypothetical protein